MTLEEIEKKRELLRVYERILKIHENLTKSQEDIQSSYLEYIKLAIKLGTNRPTFNKNYNNIIGNCYTYALDLYGAYDYFSLPDIDVGFASGYNTEVKDVNGLLERFYHDCEILGINVFNSSVESENTHGGYKIAIYFGKRIKYGDVDFHFLRENSDGTWSERIGYDGVVELYDGLPKESIEREFSYKLIKVVEIVKPIIRERK